MRGRYALLVPLLLAAASCGGASTQPTGNVPPNDVPSAGVVAASTAPDLSPVQRPAGVVITARMNDLGKSIEELDHLGKLPVNLKELTKMGLDKEGFKFIALNASFDVAVALDPTREDKPKFVFAVSIPITSVDDAVQLAQQHGDEVHPTTPGAYRAQKRDNVCDLVPALGDTPARAVCSEKAEALELLTPWMARGFSAEAKKPGDLWARIDFGPLKEKFLPKLKSEGEEGIGEIRKQMERFLNISDPELLNAPSVMLNEAFAFADDTDAIEMAFTIDDKKPEIKVSTTLAWKSKNGWLTQVIASSLDRPTTPPEMFFRLPADSSSATWGRTSDPALFTGIRRTMHKGVGSLLTLAGSNLTDADKQAFIGVFDTLPSVTGEWVSGAGIVPNKAVPDHDLTAAQAIDAAKNVAHQYLPWSISGGEGDSASVITWFKSTADALNKGSADIKKITKSKTLEWLPSAKVTENLPGYPKGSAALDVTVKFTSKEVWGLLPQNKSARQADGKWDKPEHPKGAEAHGELTFRMVVVPDEKGHMWWGYSTDPDSLRTHFAAVAKGAPASGTLTSRTDLEPIKNHSGFGGFIGLGGIFQTLRGNGALSNSEVKQMDQVITALPHKAQAPLFLLGAGNGGGTPTVTFDFIAGKEWVEDLVAAVNLGFAARAKSDAPQPTPATAVPAPPPVRH